MDERARILRAIAGPRAELWATEGAPLGAASSRVPPPPPFAAVDPELAGAAAARWGADLLAAGVPRLFAYQLLESPYPNESDLSLLDADSTPRPAAVALAALARALGDRRPLRSIERANVIVHLFGAPGEPALAVVY